MSGRQKIEASRPYDRDWRCVENAWQEAEWSCTNSTDLGTSQDKYAAHMSLIQV
jgi:hypothetical protein